MWVKHLYKLLLSLRGYLGDIESDGTNVGIFSICFCSHVQCCVRVSASSFQVLTRSGSHDITFGSNISFSAGLVRTV